MYLILWTMDNTLNHYKELNWVFEKINVIISNYVRKYKLHKYFQKKFNNIKDYKLGQKL